MASPHSNKRKRSHGPDPSNSSDSEFEVAEHPAFHETSCEDNKVTECPDRIGEDMTNDSETALNISDDQLLWQSTAEDSQSQHLIHTSMSEIEAHHNISQDSNEGSLFERSLKEVESYIQVAGDILSQDKLNDSVAFNGRYITSEPDHDSNIQFNVSAFLNEQLNEMLCNQDSTTTASIFQSESANVNLEKAIEVLEETLEGPTQIFSSTPVKMECASVSFANLQAQLESAQIAPNIFDADNQTESDLESDDEEDQSEKEDEETDEGSNHSSEEDSFDFCPALNISNIIKESNVDCSVDEPGIDMNDTLESIGNNFDGIISQSSLLNNIKIYPGSELTVNEAILKIMDLHLKNKLSKSGLARTINFICQLLPEGHKVPSSGLQILNYVESLAPPVSASRHYYCGRCFYYHGRQINGNCEICKVQTEMHYFFIFDLASLITFFFENRNLASIIENNIRNTDPSVLKDLKDGSMYQSINQNREMYDVNIILGADGIRIRKGGKKELWLAQFTIAEVPIHLQKSFLTVLGVWYHSKKPYMPTFLKPFVESMESINSSGVKWMHPKTQKVHSSRVFLPVTVLDAPARAMVQNTMYFNGKYGCNMCEIKTQRTTPLPDVKTIRVYNYIHKPPLRTKERMLRQAAKACDLNLVSVRGVKGPSILSSIPSVDVSKCVVPEYMHAVLIGVVKQVLHIWTNEIGPWSIKDKISEVDKFLKTFRHPEFVHRKVRQLKSLAGWKASDFYYFLLFEFVPSLHNILPKKYFQHFLSLVKSIYTLLQSSIPKSKVDETETLLQLFVSEFKSLYGERAQTHNLHQLLHLCLCVRLFGPLFCFDAFPFEDMNGVLAKATHGTNFVDIEIVNNVKICQGIQMLRNIVRGHDGLFELYCAFSEGEVLGKAVCNTLVLEQFDILQDPSALVYSRAKIGYDMYTSEIYKQSSSENFYIMWSDACRKTYGSIRYFAQSKGDSFVIVNLYETDQKKVFYQEKTLKCIEHFIPIKTTNKHVAIRFGDIAQSLVKVGKIGNFIYSRPNLFKFVM